MATASITPDHDVVVAQSHIAAPPERVFQAITDPRQMVQWWGDKNMYRTTTCEADVRVNGTWKSRGAMANGESFEVGGEYLEVDPPRRLVYTWRATWMGALITTVEWQLEPHDGGTLVKIQHSGFAGDAQAAKSHGEGWQLVLGWMQSFVVKGETIDTRA